MSDLDLMPPALPGEEQKKPKGFLKRFFFKDEKKEEKTEQPEDVDLDEIKRKLGLHEEAQAVSPPDDQFKPSSDEAPSVEELDVQEKPQQAEAPKEEVVEIVEQPIPTADATHPVENWEPIEREVPEVETPTPSAEEPAVPKEPSTPDEVSIPEPVEAQTHDVDSWDAGNEHKADKDNSAWADVNEAANNADSSDWAENSEPPTNAINEPEELPVVDEDTPEHHEAVDEHLSEVDSAHHKKADKALEEEKEHRDLPDWHFHDKEVHPSDYFILKNGHPVRSLRELTDALDYVTDETFEHHMNEHRNDFANWIRDVINNGNLADAVESADNRDAVLEALKVHRKSSALKVSNHIRKRKAQHKKLKTVDKDLEKAASKVEMKKSDLTELKKKTTTQVKAALDRELEKRLSEEREEMQAAIRDLEEGKSLYSKRAKECEVLATRLDRREKRLDVREQKIKDDVQKLKDTRKEHAEEKRTALELLKEAKQVKADLKKAEKFRNDSKANLSELGKRQAELTRREESLKNKQDKVNNDLKKLREEGLKVAELQKAHGKREATVVDQEKKADSLYEEAQRRMKEALDAERKATEKIKKETKKLDAVRQKMEKKLAQVIKNKKKTMYAAELRKHLEESIKETKRIVAKEHEDMEADAYKSYISNRAATQPIGQPVGASEADDVIDVKNIAIFQKVEEARAALNSNNLATAKKLYNELRSEFQSVQVPAPERNVLYTNIRELYDDIHLSMLEQ